MKTIIHDFYCIHCGNKGIMLPRKSGKLREKGHYKNLYCIHCKDYKRHLELHNDFEVNEFKDNFVKGVYADDAKNDKTSCGMSSIWKEYLR